MLKLKIGAKVISAVDLDIQDCLINGQKGNISSIEFAQGGVLKVCVTFFDKQAGVKAMRPSYLARKTS